MRLPSASLFLFRLSELFCVHLLSLLWSAKTPSGVNQSNALLHSGRPAVEITIRQRHCGDVMDERNRAEGRLVHEFTNQGNDRVPAKP